MTSVFSADGKNVPCTVIEVGPCVVTQIKTVENDGYAAVQVGFQEKKEKHTTRPEAGHFKKAGVAPMRHLAEFNRLPQSPLWAIPSLWSCSRKADSSTSQVHQKVRVSRA